jgi:hypothetical protein
LCRSPCGDHPDDVEGLERVDGPEDENHIKQGLSIGNVIILKI